MKCSCGRRLQLPRQLVGARRASNNLARSYRRWTATTATTRAPPTSPRTPASSATAAPAARARSPQFLFSPPPPKTLLLRADELSAAAAPAPAPAAAVANQAAANLLQRKWRSQSELGGGLAALLDDPSAELRIAALAELASTPGALRSSAAAASVAARLPTPSPTSASPRSPRSCRPTPPRSARTPTRWRRGSTTPTRRCAPRRARGVLARGCARAPPTPAALRARAREVELLSPTRAPWPRVAAQSRRSRRPRHALSRVALIAFRTCRAPPEAGPATAPRATRASLKGAAALTMTIPPSRAPEAARRYGRLNVRAVRRRLGGRSARPAAAPPPSSVAPRLARRRRELRAPPPRVAGTRQTRGRRRVALGWRAAAEPPPPSPAPPPSSSARHHRAAGRHAARAARSSFTDDEIRLQRQAAVHEARRARQSSAGAARFSGLATLGDAAASARSGCELRSGSCAFVSLVAAASAVAFHARSARAVAAQPPRLHGAGRAPPCAAAAAGGSPVRGAIGVLRRAHVAATCAAISDGDRRGRPRRRGRTKRSGAARSARATRRGSRATTAGCPRRPRSDVRQARRGGANAGDGLDVGTSANPFAGSAVAVSLRLRTRACHQAETCAWTEDCASARSAPVASPESSR